MKSLVMNPRNSKEVVADPAELWNLQLFLSPLVREAHSWKESDAV